MTRARKYPHLYALPDNKAGGWLYAAVFQGGLLKVGATDDPRARALSLQVVRKELIADMYVHPVPAGMHKHQKERAVLAALSRKSTPVRGREYFQGIGIDDAIRVISSVLALSAKPATAAA